MSLCWSELTTTDPKVAEAFYTKMFGWTATHSAPAKAKSLGANAMVGPNTIPDGGQFVILQDPQKAMFALYQSNQHPWKGGPYDGFALMFATICVNGSITPCTGTLLSGFSPRFVRFFRTFSPHECRSHVAS